MSPFLKSLLALLFWGVVAIGNGIQAVKYGKALFNGDKVYS